MKKTEVMLLRHDELEGPFPAWQPRTEGLSVVKFEGHVKSRTFWQVVHTQTGSTLPGIFDKRDQAEAFANSLDGLIDWTLPPEKLTLLHELKGDIQRKAWEAGA